MLRSLLVLLLWWELRVLLADIATVAVVDDVRTVVAVVEELKQITY
jgi:hypothetical protein